MMKNEMNEFNKFMNLINLKRILNEFNKLNKEEYVVWMKKHKNKDISEGGYLKWKVRKQSILKIEMLIKLQKRMQIILNDKNIIKRNPIKL